MIIDFPLIISSLPVLLKGLAVTLKITTASCCIGFLGGTLLAFMQMHTFSILRGLVTTYVIFIRGTPMLIQILFASYVLPQMGINIDTTLIAIIAIGLNSAAYISQIFRSGIKSINTGQLEAAYVLGFTKLQAARYIILPQALRIALPALGNEFTTLVKDSSLASVIGVAELSQQGRLVIRQTFDAISVFFAITLLYLLVTSTISFIINRFEMRIVHNAHD